MTKQDDIEIQVSIQMIKNKYSEAKVDQDFKAGKCDGRMDLTNQEI